MTRRGWVTVAAAGVLLLAGAGGWLLLRSPGPIYTNPVLRHDAPDPSIIEAGDGTYYAYTTQSNWPVLKRVPVLSSHDLVHWKLAGDAFPANADWVTQDVWAPHIAHNDGKYLLYYAARQYGQGDFAIGVASSDGPTGPFRDKGRPLIEGHGYVAIDPFVLTEGARSYIYWGSDGAPIRAQRLTADGMNVVGRPHAVLHPVEGGGYESLVEGAWVVRHGAYFYLMYSGDACCEPDPHYAVMVARSKSPLGPFEKDGDNPILAANKAFLGPGHNATIRDAGGQDWIVYHAFERGDVIGNRYLLIDPIQWENGWPVINGGKGPSSGPQEAPAADAG